MKFIVVTMFSQFLSLSSFCTCKKLIPNSQILLPNTLSPTVFSIQSTSTSQRNISRTFSNVLYLSFFAYTVSSVINWSLNAVCMKCSVKVVKACQYTSMAHCWSIKNGSASITYTFWVMYAMDKNAKNSIQLCFLRFCLK